MELLTIKMTAFKSGPDISFKSAVKGLNKASGISKYVVKYAVECVSQLSGNLANTAKPIAFHVLSSCYIPL